MFVQRFGRNSIFSKKKTRQKRDKCRFNNQITDNKHGKKQKVEGMLRRVGAENYWFYYFFTQAVLLKSLQNYHLIFSEVVVWIF